MGSQKAEWYNVSEKRCFREALHDRNGGILVLDDMLIEKFGEMMDGVGYLMDYCSGRTVLCHNVVSTFYHHGNQSLPLYFQPYLKKDVAENLDLWFKTRIQIAVDLLRLSLVQVNPEAVVFDAWYMSKELLDFLSSRGLIWVSEAKCNRLIEINDSWMQLKHFARSLSKSEFHRIDKQLGEKRYKWIGETTVQKKPPGWSGFFSG